MGRNLDPKCKQCRRTGEKVQYRRRRYRYGLEGTRKETRYRRYFCQYAKLFARRNGSWCCKIKKTYFSRETHIHLKQSCKKYDKRREEKRRFFYGRTNAEI